MCLISEAVIILCDESITCSLAKYLYQLFIDLPSSVWIRCVKFLISNTWDAVRSCFSFGVWCTLRWSDKASSRTFKLVNYFSVPYQKPYHNMFRIVIVFYETYVAMTYLLPPMKYEIGNANAAQKKTCSSRCTTPADNLFYQLATTQIL